MRSPGGQCFSGCCPACCRPAGTTPASLLAGGPSGSCDPSKPSAPTPLQAQPATLLALPAPCCCAYCVALCPSPLAPPLRHPPAPACRLSLRPYELSPSYASVFNKFSVRYFLNLVLVDEEDRRYFKQQVGAGGCWWVLAVVGAGSSGCWWVRRIAAASSSRWVGASCAHAGLIGAAVSGGWRVVDSAVCAETFHSLQFGSRLHQQLQRLCLSLSLEYCGPPVPYCTAAGDHAVPPG